MTIATASVASAVDFGAEISREIVAARAPWSAGVTMYPRR